MLEVDKFYKNLLIYLAIYEIVIVLKNSFERMKLYEPY